MCRWELRSLLIFDQVCPVLDVEKVAGHGKPFRKPNARQRHLVRRECRIAPKYS